MTASTLHARVGEDGVNYEGPRIKGLPAGPVYVVLFGPHASAVAQSAAMKAQLEAPAARQGDWKLLPVDSGQSWGVTSTALVHALLDQHALAIVALDRDAAHLSEQLALKTFVPVVALSGDKTLTSANIPWIFRLPSASTPAVALRLVMTAAAHGGVNSGQVRKVLASGNRIDGVAFLPTGELRGQ